MLNNIVFKPVYTSSDNPGPIDFFQNALSESCSVDIGLGYFSSAAFNVLCCGFAKFISNGGRLRLYINQEITEADYRMLKNGTPPNFDERLVNSFEKLKKTFSQIKIVKLK